jgi:hypothetical protein
VKGSEILLTPDFPHGTKAGYDRGCKGGSCPAAIPCRDVRRRYLSDADFRRLIDAGVSLEEIVSIDRAAAETDAAIEKRRRRGQPDPAPVTVASADAAEARRPTPSPPAVRPETFVKPVADVDEQWGDVGHLVEQSAPDAVPAADLTPRQREQEEVRRRTVAAEGRNARRILDALAPGPRKWAVRKVWVAIAPDGSLHGPFEGGQEEGLVFVSAQFPSGVAVAPQTDPERRTRRPWTDADTVRAKELWKAGHTDSEIGRQMERDQATVGRRLRRLGYAANRVRTEAASEPSNALPQAPAPKRASRVPGSAFTKPVREPRRPRVPSAPREIKPHGTNASYTRGCKSKTDCPNVADGGMSCYEAHLEYHRNYDLSRRTRGADGHHGTSYGYQLGCRGDCPSDPSCTAVMLEADRNRPSRADRPKRGPMVDSGPVIAHIESLRAAGMPMLAIVERTGLRKFVQTLVYGRPGGERKGQIPKQVDAVKAATVMAVRADSELTRKAG